MKITDENKIREIWRQKNIPVVCRKGKGYPLYVKLPQREANFAWLSNGKQNKPIWRIQYQCWETPKSWFNEVVEKVLDKFNRVYVIQPYNEQEKCTPSCRNAVGHKCECSCMGANHGAEGTNRDWLTISDAFATEWRGADLACRLLHKKDSEVFRLQS